VLDTLRAFISLYISYDDPIGGAEGRLKWMKELRGASGHGSSSMLTSSATLPPSSSLPSSMVPQSPQSQRSRMSATGTGTGASGSGGGGIGSTAGMSSSSIPPLSSHGRSSGRHYHNKTSSISSSNNRRSGTGAGGNDGDSSDDASTDGTTSVPTHDSASNPHRTNVMATAAARLSTSLASVSGNAVVSSSNGNGNGNGVDAATVMRSPMPPPSVILLDILMSVLFFPREHRLCY
jgi:hypothetical protein